jgi:hypothetical protein
LSCLALGGVTALASEARASSPFLEIPDPEVVMQTPAYRYANMSDDEAYAELDRRGILYSKVSDAPGVRAPIRLTGRLHGVLVRSALPPEERASSIFEICDARLALALDDFAEILSRHDVDEVVHYTMYRPNVPQASVAAAAPTSTPTAQGKTGPQGKGGAGTPAVDDGKRASHGAKRRAFIDEKGTKSSKSHGSLLRGAGEGRHKELRELDKVALSDESGADARPTRELEAAGIERAEIEGAELLGKSGPPAVKGAAAAGQKPVVVGKGAAPGSSAPSTSFLKKGSSPGAKSGKATPKRATPGAFDDDLHGKWAPPGTRHPAGLAIDVGGLKKKDGKMLSVASDFEGKLGDRTCGPGAPVPESGEARELRSIVCEAHDAGIFTYTLTPNYNAAHRDHFHMEIKPGVVWFLYH